MENKIRILDKNKVDEDRRYMLLNIDSDDNFSDIEEDLTVDESVIKELSSFKYNGFLYSPRMISYEKGICICDKITVPKHINHTLTMDITCPYCGYKYLDSWDEKSEGDMECPQCESMFSFERIATVEYTTSKVKESNLKVIEKIT